MTDRWDYRPHSEAATAAYLTELGNEPLGFGAAQLSDRARQLQARDKAWPPDLTRWLADNLVRAREGSLVYVDAKFSLPGSHHFSVEMRSMLAARLQTRPLWYVCSRMTEPGVFSAYRAMLSTDVPRYWPCCGTCGAAYWGDVQIANAALAKYCPVPSRGDGSSTPYFVIPTDADGWWRPNPFGIAAPYKREGPCVDDCPGGHSSCEFGLGLDCLNGNACENPHHYRREVGMPGRR